MKMAGIFIIGMNMVMALPLCADAPAAPGNFEIQESAHLKRDEKNLERMQANRGLDNTHSGQAQEDFRKGTADLSDHDEQQLQDVQALRSVESQVTAGQKQKDLAHKSYKEAVQKYGSHDSRSAEARQNLKDSRHAMKALRQSRRTLRGDVQEGHRRVHNDKTMLGMQKRALESNARYVTNDDRQIKREESKIADDRKSMR